MCFWNETATWRAWYETGCRCFAHFARLVPRRCKLEQTCAKQMASPSATRQPPSDKSYNAEDETVHIFVPRQASAKESPNAKELASKQTMGTVPLVQRSPSDGAVQPSGMRTVYSKD